MHLFKRTLFLFLTLSSCCAIAQDHFGYKINLGASWISYQAPDQVEIHQVNSALAAQTGIYVGHDIGRVGYFGMEVLVQQITGHSYVENNITSPGGQVIAYVYNDYNLLSYISCPVYVGLKYKQMTFLTGIQASYLLRSKRRVKSEAFGGSFAQPHSFDDKATKYRFNLGALVGLHLQLTPTIGVESSYCLGLNDLQKSSFYGERDHRVKYAMLGFRFNILQKNRE